ncbi:hypothetical protein [uncultured Hyphomicrobium sp.]|uniref:hypothetical protein n=1 Tax=uncultured Hyphomicrobium sp. TaxID=194373 RepID=UPI0025F04FCD|nr:hypothetical protein [uncultured Hyphomicrobium sp.]
MAHARSAIGRCLAILTAMLLIAAVMDAATIGIAASADAKWPADDVLRSGMAAIRKATLDSHTLVTHRRMPPASARSFAERIRKEADRIEADAAVPLTAKPDLKTLLADIVAGAEAVAGRGGELTPIDGIIQIDTALARYPERFDDPTWQPLR